MGPEKKFARGESLGQRLVFLSCLYINSRQASKLLLLLLRYIICKIDPYSIGGLLHTKDPSSIGTSVHKKDPYSGALRHGINFSHNARREVM